MTTLVHEASGRICRRMVPEPFPGNDREFIIDHAFEWRPDTRHWRELAANDEALVLRGEIDANLERAARAGAFDWNDAIELSSLVESANAGDAIGDDIVVFKSVGMAIEDVAVGAKLLELAHDK